MCVARKATTVAWENAWRCQHQQDFTQWATNLIREKKVTLTGKTKRKKSLQRTRIWWWHRHRAHWWQLQQSHWHRSHCCKLPHHLQKRWWGNQHCPSHTAGHNQWEQKWSKNCKWISLLNKGAIQIMGEWYKQPSVGLQPNSWKPATRRHVLQTWMQSPTNPRDHIPKLE